VNSWRETFFGWKLNRKFAFLADAGFSRTSLRVSKTSGDGQAVYQNGTLLLSITLDRGQFFPDFRSTTWTATEAFGLVDVAACALGLKIESDVLDAGTNLRMLKDSIGALVRAFNRPDSSLLLQRLLEQRNRRGELWLHRLK
jgi:hypothetical protein